MQFMASLLVLAAWQTTPLTDFAQPTPLPGGFVDPSGRIGVFNTPGGGLQALTLADGKVFFQTKQAQRALFISGEKLYALAAVQAPVVRGPWFVWYPEWEGPRHGFRLLVFDLARFGEEELQSEVVPLPEWASLADAFDRSFSVQSKVEQGQLTLTWTAKASFKEPAARKQVVGAVRFDLATAALELLPEPPVVLAPPVYEPWPELERLAIRWHKRTAAQLRVLTLTETTERQTLSLRTYETGSRRLLAERELLSGQKLIVLPSIDERYLGVREASASPDVTGSDVGKTVHWSLFRADDGQCVGEVPYEPGTTAAALLGGRVYFLSAGRIDSPLDRPFVVPRMLRAVDLKTGMTVWERPVGGKPASPPPAARPLAATDAPAKKPANRP